MPNKNHKTGLNSIHPQEDDKNLWQILKIYFKLDFSVFSNNKISGSIAITPEEAVKLIDYFVLVANDSTRFIFNCNFRKISASGFDPTKTNLSVYIEAIPKNKDFKPKQSERQPFSFTHQLSPLTPILTFKWPPLTNSKPSLIVRWYHIGDKIAQKYVFCLDNKEIQYIRQPSGYDAYQICIHNFQPGTDHFVQIIATLNNGKETYKSDFIPFTVPDKSTRHDTEVLNVSEEPGIPYDFQDEKNQEKKIESPQITNQLQNKTPEHFQRLKSQIEKQQTYDEIDTILSCGCKGPHQYFPGIEHYLNINNNKSPSIIQTSLPYKRTTSSDKEDTNDNDDQNEDIEEEEETDDDNDVVMEDDSTNT